MVKIKNCGFKINKIVITGINKQNASLKFEYGLNVISGASDTGKSYIFQAINYVLGEKNKPKEIIEAKGYDEIYLEIEDYNKNIYTLKRSLCDGKMFCYKSSFDLKDAVVPEKIIEENDKKNENNISTFLLKLCKSPYKNVVKNKKGVVQSFTFRDFARIALLDEEKIISNKSIVLGSIGNVAYTANKNAFKTIITGLEDKGKESDEDKKLNNMKIDAKIEVVDRIIYDYNEELRKIETQSDEFNVDEISILIKKIKNIITEKKQLIREIDKQRQLLLSDISKKESFIEYNNELNKKFKLLKKNYLSDYERIEFIDEANYYINQLDNIVCPICSSKIDEVPIDTQSIKEGIDAEKKKLEKKISDISELINEIIQKKENIIIEKNKILNKVDELTNEMNNELEPIMDLKINELKILLDRRDEVERKNFLKNKIKEENEIRDELTKSKDEIDNDEIRLHTISNVNKENLCSEISKLLDEWKLFLHPDVDFNLKSYDLIINNKEKSSFGKGYRALINSAFAIAIMKYNLALKLPHPNIIILDSPLITFKDKDMNKEQVNEEVKKKFYEYLAKEFKEQQIIILENAEPHEEVKDKINYYHFSKNNEYGRYGFFPIKNNL